MWTSTGYVALALRLLIADAALHSFNVRKQCISFALITFIHVLVNIWGTGNWVFHHICTELYSSCHRSMFLSFRLDARNTANVPADMLRLYTMPNRWVAACVPAVPVRTMVDVSGNQTQPPTGYRPFWYCTLRQPLRCA
jgi:hypothetical protein